MDNDSPLKSRATEFRSSTGGKLTACWQLTDCNEKGVVKLTLPPMHIIPIIFIPGIMGSNLADLQNRPVWLLNSIGNKPLNLAWKWGPRTPGERQLILHPERTTVFRNGAVPERNASNNLNKQDFLNRGWGEVSEASYMKFLLWLDEKMNGSRNPSGWPDFSQKIGPASGEFFSALTNTLSPDAKIFMQGLPETNEASNKVEPIKSEELMLRAKSVYPVYAFGYNWLDSNTVAADKLKKRIEDIIKENNRLPSRCMQVILVTHSMGGLVARACSLLAGMDKKILGVVHGVMPATGAAVAYRRCKVGMQDEDAAAALVIGSDGKKVTAVFAQAPGALQLLPSESYGTHWLRITDTNGKILASYPASDPYEEIYLQRNRWWSLIREEWLSPEKGKPISWGTFETNIKKAKDFHNKISGKYHKNTFAFYGGGKEKKSFEKVEWIVKKGNSVVSQVDVSSIDSVPSFSDKLVRTDGSNSLFVGGGLRISTTSRGDTAVAQFRQESFWEIHCAMWNSSGDGTVPTVSGRAPRIFGGASIRQLFELAGVEHEPAFRDYPAAQTITHYAITKLAALAERS